MDDPSSPLQRSFKRFATREPVRFSCASAAGSAQLLNASQDGVFVSTESPPKPGEHVRIELTRQRPSVHLEGEVRWNSLEAEVLVCGFGVHLINPGAGYAQFIEHLREAEERRR